MNLNDELQVAIKNVAHEAERGTVQAFLLMTMTSGRPAIDCQGEFSSLFKALFDASIAIPAVKELVKATSAAIESYERLHAVESRSKGGAE